MIFVSPVIVLMRLACTTPPEPVPGDRVVLRAAHLSTGKCAPVPAARSRTALRLRWEAIDGREWEEAARLRREGLIIDLPDGTDAVVRHAGPAILVGPDPAWVRVEVLDGREKGAEVWVADWAIRRP
jgi:hypothetical protein